MQNHDIKKEKSIKNKMMVSETIKQSRGCMRNTILAACVLLGMTLRAEINGTLVMPTEWTVFPYVSADLDFKTLNSLPTSINVDGRAVIGQKMMVKNSILDLKAIFGKIQLGNTAYVFIPLTSTNKQEITLGMGADWWLRAWVNGKEIVNTQETGNLDWPPHITNFTRNVMLNKGINILTVKFISGSGSSVLTVGGPDELRKIPPDKWLKMDYDNTSRLCYVPKLQENYSSEGPTELAGIDIVIRREATISEKTAAQELVGYLERSTGRKSAIVIEGDCKHEGSRIYVGATKYAMKHGIDSGSFNPEQWLIRSTDKNLIVSGGNPRGVLYAAYHFLEKVVGIRWWSPWEEFVPQHNNGLAAGKIDLSGEPVFRLRCLNTYNLYYTQSGAEKLWAPRNRINTEMFTGIPLKYGGGIEYGPPSFVHTESHYYKILQTQGILKPEWVALKNGKREIKPSGKALEEYQLCLSNPELRKAVLKVMLKNIQETEKRENPPSIFDFSFNDISTRCECTSCAAMVKKYGGSDAGLMLDFLNELADSVKEKYPEVMLHTLAYMNTEPVPDNIVPRDNIMITLCDTVSSYTTPLANESRFIKLLGKWSKIAGKIKVWDYHTTFGDWALPMPFESTFQPDLQLLKKNGVYGVMTEYHGVVFEDMRDLRFWILAKLYEDPYQDMNKLIEIFTDGFYGTGGKFIRKYLVALQEATLMKPGDFQTKSTLESCSYITPELIIKAQSYFDEAEKAVGNSDMLLRRLRHARLGMDKAAYVFYPKIILKYAAVPLKISFNREILAERIKKTVAEQYDLRTKSLTGYGQQRATKDKDRFFHGFLNTEIQMDNCDSIDKITWNQPAWRPRFFTKEAIGKLEVSKEHKVEGKSSVRWTVSAQDVKNKLKEIPGLRFVRLNYLYGFDFSRIVKIKFYVKSEVPNHPPLFATMISPSGKYKNIPVLERNEATNGWREVVWELEKEAGQICTHIYLSIFSYPNQFEEGDSIELYLDDIRIFR